MVDDDIAGGPRVLVADDDPSCLTVYRLLLEQSGMRVVTARDGKEAIALLEAAARRGLALDLLLLDIRMPGASGWEVLARSRELAPPGGSPPRALLMTGFSVELDIDRVTREGATGVLIKPISNRALVHEVRRVLSLPAGLAAQGAPGSQER